MYYFSNKTLILLILSSLLFISCTTKNIDLLSEDSLYKLGLENTKIKSIIHDDEVHGIVNLTYLNPTIKNEYDKKTNDFIVGIYLENYENKYNIKVNDKNYLSKTLIKKGSKLYKSIPSYNPYSKYYIIKYKKDKSTTLNINFIHNVYGTLLIKFKTY